MSYSKPSCRAATMTLAILCLGTLAGCRGGGSESRPPVPLVSEEPAVKPLSVSAARMSFEGLRGQAMEPVTVNIESGAGWTVTSDQPWIESSALRGDGDGALTVSVLPEFAGIGRNEGMVAITGEGDTGEAVLSVDLTIGDVLEAGDSELLFEVISGAIDLRAGTLSVSGQDVSWAVTTEADWIALTSEEGVGPATIGVDVDPTGMPVGKHAAEIVVRDKDFDQEVVFTSELTVEPRRVALAEVGVSLSSFPSSSRLSREIAVTENLGQSLIWSASSDAAWLNVTEAGSTPGTLNVDANVEGLAPGYHSAEVRLTSDDGTVSNVELVQVGLWVGETDPQAMVSVSVEATNLVTDPVRPYAYVSGQNESDVKILNVHTGEQVGEIENVTARNGVMAVSPDGALLYVFDRSNLTIVPVRLDTKTIYEDWTPNSMAGFVGQEVGSLAVGRVDGKMVLFTGTGKAFDAGSGREVLSNYGVDFYFDENSVAISRSAAKMCVMNRGVSPYSLYCFEPSFSYVNEQLSLFYNGNVEHGAGSNGQDVALSNDGTRAYAASGAPYEFNVFDTTTMRLVQTLPADAYPNAAEVGPNGTFYGGTSGSTDAWAYDSSGRLLSTYSMDGWLLDHQITVSGDGSRVLFVTAESFFDENGRVFISSAP